MAALGSVGHSIFYEYTIASTVILDVYSAKNISLNPVGGIETYLNTTAVDPGGRKTINGHLYDQSNNPIQRTVICVDQASKLVVDTTVSDPSTGAFTLRPPLNNKCSVFYIPNLGDARNGVILSDLVPI